MKKVKDIKKDYYCVPHWCVMYPFGHFDNMGGCWGISGGHVLSEGEKYCKSCEYYEKRKEP